MEKLKDVSNKSTNFLSVKRLKSLGFQIWLVSKAFLFEPSKKGQSAKLKLQSQIDTKVNGVLVHGFPFQSMVYWKFMP